MKFDVNKRDEFTSFLPNNTIFTGEKGQISLLPPNHFTFGMYEIYCLEGDLIDDTERYSSKQEALERISELLGEPLPDDLPAETGNEPKPDPARRARRRALRRPRMPGNDEQE